MEQRLDEYQGRTQKQQDSNEAVGAVSVMLFLGGILIMAIYSLVSWLAS